MKDLSVIVRRALRRKIKTGDGIDRIVGELLGENWQQMLSGNPRQRDAMADKLTRRIHQHLNDSSFVSSTNSPASDLNRPSVVS